MKRLSLFKGKRKTQFEHNKFLVQVQTNESASFIIKYPRKDYSPRIDECTSTYWERTLHVLKSKPLFVEVFVCNPTAVKKLMCTLKIDELNADDEIIHTVTHSFNVPLKLDDWKWQRFELKSKLDYAE